MSVSPETENAPEVVEEKYPPAIDTKFSREAKEKLDATMAKMVIFNPIYGTVFLFLNKIQSRSLPTMGVGIIRRVDLALYYNPDFVLSLTDTELKAVLIHESLHVLLHHIARAEHFDYNRKNYNITADMAINCHISGLPNRDLIRPFYPKTFELPDFQSAEWYYEKLKREAEKHSKDIGDVADGKGDLVDSHEGWGDCDNDMVKEKVRAIADKAVKAQDAKGWSEIGTNLAKAIIEANKPIVNWKREVRYFINKMVLAGRKSTRTRINRREQYLKKNRKGDLAQCYIQPGNKQEYRSRLLVALDTSGSVSDAELQQFIAEINGMTSHIVCDVIMFDTSICCEPIPISKKITNFEVKGRGGTDFNPPVRFAESHKYDGLIMFTDGHCGFPDPPRGVRVLWGITPPGDMVVPPWGKRVRIEIKGK
jgi:predicted metal-dependent peptidase